MPASFFKKTLLAAWACGVVCVPHLAHAQAQHSQVNLSTQAKGVLPIANGGTGTTTGAAAAGATLPSSGLVKATSTTTGVAATYSDVLALVNQAPTGNTFIASLIPALPYDASGAAAAAVTNAENHASNASNLSTGTVAVARLPVGTNSTLGAAGCDSTTTSCANGVISVIGGAAGPAGPPAAITMATPVALAAGSAPTASISGTAPNYTITLGLPPGPAGVAGQTPVLTFSTSTLAAGSSATATVSGTAPNYAIALGIPAGPAGTNGTPGTNGLQGPAGGANPVACNSLTDFSASGRCNSGSTSYNMVGDGATDNYPLMTGLIAALDSTSPHSIEIPVGKYYFSQPIVTTKPLTIHCEGQPGSPDNRGVQLIGTAAMDAIFEPTASSPTSGSQTNGFEIDNCSFGRTVASVKAGVKITVTENLRMHHNSFQGFKSVDYAVGTATMTNGSNVITFGGGANVPDASNGFIAFGNWLPEFLSCSDSANTCTMPGNWQGPTTTGPYNLNVGGFAIWVAPPASASATVFSQYWDLYDNGGQNNSVDIYMASATTCPTSSALGTSRFNIIGGHWNNKTSDSRGVYIGCFGDTMNVNFVAVNNVTKPFEVWSGHANVFTGVMQENNAPSSYVSGLTTCTGSTVSGGTTYTGINTRSCSTSDIIGGDTAYISDDNQFLSPYANQTGIAFRTVPGLGVPPGSTGSNPPRRANIRMPRVSNSDGYFADGGPSSSGTTYEDYQTYCKSGVKVYSGSATCPTY